MPSITSLRSIVQTCSISLRSNCLPAVIISRLLGEELADHPRQLDGFFLGDKMAAVRNRAALGLQCNATQRLHDQIAAPASPSATDTERGHRQLEAGRKQLAIVGDVL